MLALMKYRKLSSPPFVSLSLLAMLETMRIAYIYCLREGSLVQHVPDDGFYYLQAARSFARLGKWTFDGVEPASGFHLLWGYFLAAVYYIRPSIDIKTVFLISSIAASLSFVSSAFLLMKVARRLAGNDSWMGVLVVYMSAISLSQPTYLVESSFALLLNSLLFYLLSATNGLGAPWVLTFCLGVLGALCRSDSGLLIFWLFIIQICLWRLRWTTHTMVRTASAALLGEFSGIGIVSFHTHWISGEWAQASAQVKYFWSRIEGRSPLGALRVVCSFVRPITDFRSSLPHGHIETLINGFNYLIVFLALSGIVIGIIFGVRDKLFRKNGDVLIVAACFSTIGSYIIFYSFNSSAVQRWYAANFEAPFAIIAGVGSAWFLTNHRKRTSLALGFMCCCGAGFSFLPAYPWQEPTWRAGIYLRENPKSYAVAAWNAGIVGYFADVGVVNIDGLMNDALLPYIKSNSMDKYFIRRNIRYVIDIPGMWGDSMARRGGYQNSNLVGCISQTEDLFPNDPMNQYSDRHAIPGVFHIYLYELNSACLIASMSR